MFSPLVNRPHACRTRRKTMCSESALMLAQNGRLCLPNVYTNYRVLFVYSNGKSGVYPSQNDGCRAKGAFDCLHFLHPFWSLLYKEQPRPKGAENFWGYTEENIDTRYDGGGLPDPPEHARRNMLIFDNGDPLWLRCTRNSKRTTK